MIEAIKGYIGSKFQLLRNRARKSRDRALDDWDGPYPGDDLQLAPDSSYNHYLALFNRTEKAYHDWRRLEQMEDLGRSHPDASDIVNVISRMEEYWQKLDPDEY